MGKARATVYGGASISLLATSRPDDAPAILVDPKLAIEQLEGVTHALGRTFAALQTELRPLDQATLEGEEWRLLQVVGRQWVDGWVGQQIASHAKTIVSTVRQFVEAYDEATTVLHEIGPRLQASREHIKARKAGLMIATDVERVTGYENVINKTQRVYTDLEDSLIQATPWVAAAKASALRTAEAAGRTILRIRVEHIAAELATLRSRAQVIRTGTHPTLDEVALAIQDAERLCETHIRLPDITWPRDGDLFSAPTLKEWGSN
jgi:hypothetical protein